jgi:DNA-binding NarL/FixJ family response regulator
MSFGVYRKMTNLGVFEMRSLANASCVNGHVNGQGRQVDPVRVLVVDDHEGFRSSMVQALKGAPHVVVAGEADSGERACVVATELEPDVVLIDFSMPGMNGIDATRMIRSANPETRVVILTASAGDALEESALAAGASLVVPKGTPIEDVVGVILNAAGEGESE